MKRSILRVLLREKAISSLGEGRRLIECGGVYVDGQKVDDFHMMLVPGTYAIKCGKRLEFSHTVPADETPAPSEPLETSLGLEWTREKPMPSVWYEYRWADEPDKVYTINAAGSAWGYTAPEFNEGRRMEFRGPIPSPSPRRVAPGPASGEEQKPKPPGCTIHNTLSGCIYCERGNAKVTGEGERTEA